MSFDVEDLDEQPTWFRIRAAVCRRGEDGELRASCKD